MTESQVKSYWEGLITQIQTNNKHALDEGKIKKTLTGANADTQVCRNKPADTVVSTQTRKQHRDGVFFGPSTWAPEKGTIFFSGGGGKCRFYIYGRAIFSDSIWCGAMAFLPWKAMRCKNSRTYGGGMRVIQRLLVGGTKSYGVHVHLAAGDIHVRCRKHLLNAVNDSVHDLLMVCG